MILRLAHDLRHKPYDHQNKLRIKIKIGN